MGPFVILWRRPSILSRNFGLHSSIRDESAQCAVPYGGEALAVGDAADPRPSARASLSSGPAGQDSSTPVVQRSTGRGDVLDDAEPAAAHDARMTDEFALNQEAACPWCSEPSAAARGRTHGARTFAGRGECRENLLNLIPSALGALGRFRAAAQDELLEDVAAISAGVFKQGHGLFTPWALGRSFLALTSPRGSRTQPSAKPSHSGTARQHTEPDRQKEKEYQELFHILIIAWAVPLRVPMNNHRPRRLGT